MPRGRPRSSETREAESRASDAREVPKTTHTSRFYIPPHIIPKNTTYAWVAVKFDEAGTPNQSNWANKYRSGWRPVPRSRHPDIFPMIPNVGFGASDGEIIEEGGQILCEKPTRDVNASKKENERRALEQMNGISWTQDSGQNPFAQTMPRFDESSKVQFGHNAEFKE